ncbi:DEAD/DEAH box helicase [Candidatus Woesearchaeota archaeon]|nr:DEAD/DEAH box helicase [Candidatus Woesearchaeota archaeon]
MYEIIDLNPRDYQKSIFSTCKEKSSLVILPTGIGKTAISVMLSIYRLNTFKDSKVVICSPTKPLCSQHLKTFTEHTNIPKEKIILYTGAIKPKERIELWKHSTIIIATPQTILSDLKNSRINMNDISLLTIDEAHRSRMKYANTIVASYYNNQSKFPLVLGLTASPGSSKEKIEEICTNLNIHSIEIRTEEDEDVKPYIKEKKINFVKIQLPEEYKELKSLIEEVYLSSLENLKAFGLTKPKKIVNKKDLLLLRKYIESQLKEGNKAAYHGLSLVAQAMKLDHAVDLLETQGLEPLSEYWLKLKNDQTKAAKSIILNTLIQKAIIQTKELIDKNNFHPKLTKLKSLIEDTLELDKNSRIIIFANYRDTVKSIVNFLNKSNNIKSIELMGQKEGITQKTQIDNIKKFDLGIYNVLVGTSIGEEGLHIGEASIAIFYDSVSSEIRTIQRSGRVGRVKSGEVIFLMTEGSRDEAFYWVAKRKEKSMKKTVQQIKNKELSQSSLEDINDKSNINRP